MRRPRVKAVHAPFALPGNRIVIGLLQCGVAAEITDDDEGSLERLLVLMDGTRDLEAVIANFTGERPGWDPGSVRDVVRQLVARGFVEDAAAELPASLSPDEAIRYESNRHFMSWIDVAPRSSPYHAQARLKDARISLLGLGGTGSAVAAALVASGIGGLHCTDFDTVAESNLTRQFLYDERDIGMPKVGQACKRLRAMNRYVDVTGEDLQVSGVDDIVRLMAGKDAFILCADTPPEIVSWTNAAALRAGVPWFICFYTGPVCVVGHFVPWQTACWECLQRALEADVEERRLINDVQRPNAVVAANANIGGQLCALEVVFHLTGLRAQTRGSIFHFDCGDWTHVYHIAAPREALCVACREDR